MTRWRRRGGVAGAIAEERLREVMTTMGDRWTDDQVDELFHCSPISAGHFNYVDFVRAIKHGTRRDADDDPFKVAPPAPASPVPAARAPAPAAPAAPVTPPAASVPKASVPASGGGGGGGSGKSSSTPSVAPNSDVVNV